jgi:hypothetical protein
MRTIRDIHRVNAERHAPSRPRAGSALLALAKGAYHALVPRRLRYLRYRAQMFLFDHMAFQYAVEELRPRRDFFRRAFTLLVENGIDGDYMEFGCAGGSTFGLAYRYAARTGHPARLWAVDSFQGLPRSNDPRDSHPLWQEGYFNTSLDEFIEICAMRGIPRSRFETVQGFYADTLSPSSPAFGQLPKNIAFAFIDCDLYTSTKSVLDFLAPRLKHGMLIAFDDYFAHSETSVAGERLAFLEFQKTMPQFAFLPYIQYGTMGQSFIVESRSLTNGRA